MIHLTVDPTTFAAGPHGQNPFTSANYAPNPHRAAAQHTALRRSIPNLFSFPAPADPQGQLPDLPYFASAGLSLPRLPKPIVILPWMKYSQRRNEHAFFKLAFEALGVETIPFPGNSAAPFEGQPECKWLQGGRVLFMTYGYRATKRSVQILTGLLRKIYTSYGVPPPRVISAEVQSPNYYHLDLALFCSQHGPAVLHAGALSSKGEALLRKALGPNAPLELVETKDPFALNAIEEGGCVYTHRHTDPKIRRLLAKISGKRVVEFDVSEFEKGGGSVRCLVFDLFMP